MEPTIALVFSPELWVERLHHHLTDHGGARVRQIVLEPALALEDEYDTLVVSHRWPGLTHAFVEAVHQRSRCVLGVFDPDETAGREHLAALGVDGTIPSDAAVSEFIEALTALTPARLADSRRAGGRRCGDGRSRPDGRSPARPEPAPAKSRSGWRRRSQLGVRPPCSSMPTSWRRRPPPGSAWGSSPTSAARSTRSSTASATWRARSCGPVIPPSTCCAGSRAWPRPAQIRSREVLDVLGALGRVRSQVLVEVSGVPGIEIARAVIADAGVLVGVGAANPVGVARLLGWVAALPPSEARVHLVLNRAPTDRYQRAELTQEISRTFTPASLTFVPTDRRVERAAWTGQLVPRGPFTTGVAALAHLAVPRAARSGRAERRVRRTRRSSSRVGARRTAVAQ